MDLLKIHSVTKKVFVALLGAFLLLFLLFHATANMFILRHDGGAWYSAFCHFMGSNWLVKIFEVVLLGVFLLHMLLTLWLAVTNWMARPVRYHQPQKSKTHATSKLMIWTGVLIFACLCFHFYDFYLVKHGIVKGEYMVKVEKLDDGEIMQMAQFAQQMGMTPEEFVDELESEAMMYTEWNGDDYETQRYIEDMRGKVAVLGIMQRAIEEGNFSEDHKWIHHLTYDDRQVLRSTLPQSKPEPDFYYMARDKFSHLHIVLAYLVFFVIVFLHLRHAFPSAFQSLGWNGGKYTCAIEVLGKIYTWVVILMFASVPVLVYLGV